MEIFENHRLFRTKHNFAEIDGLFNGNVENVSGLLLCISGAKPGFYGGFSSDPMSGTVIPLKELKPRMERLKAIARACELQMEVKREVPFFAERLGRRWDCEFLVCGKGDLHRRILAKAIFKEKSHKKRAAPLGEFLGYAPCCVKYYTETEEEPQKRRDAHSIGELQNFIGYQPCSNGCKRSKELAELYAKTIKEISEELFERIKNQPNKS